VSFVVVAAQVLMRVLVPVDRRLRPPSCSDCSNWAAGEGAQRSSMRQAMEVVVVVGAEEPLDPISVLMYEPSPRRNLTSPHGAARFGPRVGGPSAARALVLHLWVLPWL